MHNSQHDNHLLDTSFTSPLSPFSTIGSPHAHTEHFEPYYPTNLLLTPYHIIFFSLSPIIFQPLQFTPQKPFKHVLIHPLIPHQQP
ncbi:class I tRNA ligase family protein, partial [Bacillus pumilus]|uniref:class I tRNA ligase family protein n=1 Tax=Bacillus pumilus TaxID=1408 RepID=UPI0034D97475